ncbi:MAG: methyl-accepting chemotaxis protein [Magnetospirillum sp.]|nr:methyl-accepting chemotaxis protein [Magnetospirillum sp.]
MAQPTAPDVVDPKTLLTVLAAVERGDFSQRMPEDWTGIAGKVADTLNRIIDTADRTIAETSRACEAVGRDGHFSDRLRSVGAHGKWESFIDAGNTLIADFVSPMADLIGVMNRLAEGELRVRMPLERSGIPLKGEFHRLAEIVNTMVAQLGGVASEVTRVAREVGTEGETGQPGRGPGRRRYLEGPDRQRQSADRQPHRPGAQHRRGHHRRRQGRPVQEDHRRRQRRGP